MVTSLKDVKYILSIGKRQPMHIGHMRALERILAIKDRRLVYVIGSTNAKTDPLFDPLTNPLDLKQQIKQFQVVFPDADPVFIAIKDVPEMGQWGDILIAALARQGIKPEECVIHFIGKDEDRLEWDMEFSMRNGQRCLLNKGQWLIEALTHWGFQIWFDEREDADLSISARNLRKVDLFDEEQIKLLAAPEFLRNLAVKAREGNPEFAGNPITLYDLSWQRMKCL